MDHDYKVYKCPHLGWTAETNISLGETDEGKQRVLSFVTVKRAVGVTTNANVWEIDKNTGMKSTAMYQDYRAAVKKHDVRRATQKAITQAHLIALPEFDQHIDAAKAQYAE